MPDADKLKKVAAIGMRLVNTCATCQHGVPQQARCGPHWGVCKLHIYKHGKHGTRRMPTHILAVCDSYKRTTNVSAIGGFGVYSSLIPWQHDE